MDLVKYLRDSPPTFAALSDDRRKATLDRAEKIIRQIGEKTRKVLTSFSFPRCLSLTPSGPSLPLSSCWPLSPLFCLNSLI